MDASKDKQFVKRIFADLRYFGLFALLLIAGAWSMGAETITGLSVGLFGGALSFFSLWGVVSLLGSTTKHTGWARFRGFFFFSLFLFKLPILTAMIYYVHGLGPVTGRAFLFGIGMVYLWAVGWAESTKD